jgi:hypothetical protein
MCFEVHVTATGRFSVTSPNLIEVGAVVWKYLENKWIIFFFIRSCKEWDRKLVNNSDYPDRIEFLHDQNISSYTLRKSGGKEMGHSQNPPL